MPEFRLDENIFPAGQYQRQMRLVCRQTAKRLFSHGFSGAGVVAFPLFEVDAYVRDTLALKQNMAPCTVDGGKSVKGEDQTVIL